MCKTKNEFLQIMSEHALFDYKINIQNTIHEKETKYRLVRHLARQNERYEMILDIEWYGNKSVYFEEDFGTDAGICDWITPNSDTIQLIDITPGCETGSQNGLQLMLDAETFDYGSSTE